MGWRIIGSLVLVVLTGGLLAGSAASTFERTDSRLYPLDFAGASWIQVPDGAASGYFRHSFQLDRAPDLATLWIDADQWYQVYVDGAQVADSLAALQAGRPALADPVDLSSRLHRGTNAIGVRVVNGDDRPAAFRARLSLSFGAEAVDSSTSPTTWLATSDVRRVNPPRGRARIPTFSQPAFDAGQWSYAAPAVPVRRQAWSLMPPEAVAGPLAGTVISAAGASTDMLASTTVTAPAGPTDGWLRVVSPGGYTVAVDGSTVIDEPAARVAGGTGTRQGGYQAAVHVYDVAPYFHDGRNTLTVHVLGGAPAPAISLDGWLETPRGTVSIATGPRWHAAAPPLPATGQAASRPAVVLGPVSRIWAAGVRRRSLVPDLTLPASRVDDQGQSTQAPLAPLPAVPGQVTLRFLLIAIPLLVALWLAFAAVTALALPSRMGRARWRGWSSTFGRGLLLDAAGHLPALATLGAVASLAHLSNWTPPWPYTPVVFWLLVATLAAGKVSAPLALCRPGMSGVRPLWRRGRALRRIELPRIRPAAMSALDWATEPLRAWAGAPAGGGRPRLAMATAGAGTGPATLPPGAAPARQPAGEPRPTPTHATPRRAMRSLGRLASRLGWLASRLDRASTAVVLTALGCTALMAYRLGYEPYSPDEAASLLVERSIRAHLLPRFPSGAFYFKGELYHYLLSVVGAVTADNQVAIRSLSVLTYGLTVLAFGLLLLPIVLPGRRLARVALTVLFATAPMVLRGAREVRMYPQEQLFVIVFVSLFLLALRSARAATGLTAAAPPPPELPHRLGRVVTRWSIPLSAVALVGMYLSHEESFILLPAIPVVFLAGLRLRWLRDRRWLQWGGPALVLIAAQYWLTIVTRAPSLGVDHSNMPYVSFDPSQFYFYLARYLFAIPAGSGGVPVGTGNDGSLYLLTSLAVLAGVVGAARRDFDRFYLSGFLWLSVLVLSTAFSAHAERYIFVLLPLLFVLGGMGALDVLGWLRQLLRAPESPLRERRLAAGLVLTASVPGFVWVGSSLPVRVQDYGLAASRLAGVQYARHYPDYEPVAAYLRAHERPGDVFVTLGPTAVLAYYVGRAPDAVIQPHPNRLLYLMERDGTVVEDYYGSPAILTADDLQQVIATQNRVWLLTDGESYFGSVPANVRNVIRTQFREVAEGPQTALYYRGG